MIKEIITQTPLYVWGILAYLLFIGWKATKPRVIWVPKLFLIPFFLTLSKWAKIASFSYTYSLLSWLIGLMLGTLMGAKHQKIEFLVKQNSIRLPGSFTTLWMFLTLFTAKYILGILEELDIHHLQQYQNIDTMVTFLFSGYSFSKATAYTLRFIKYKHRHHHLPPAQ